MGRDTQAADTGGVTATGPTAVRATAGRPPGGRRRGLLATLVAAALVVPLSAAAWPRIPAPAPAALGRVTAASLDEAYAANRADAAEAARMAAAHGDRHRAAADRALAGPGRQLLAFDGRGAGLATEVLGDLARADRVAVLVPGSDTSLDTYARFRAGAVALRAQLARQAPQGTRTAVVAWLGYRTPGTVSAAVTTTGRAEQAAPRLRALVRQLHTLAGPRAHLSLLCHSYGSVVCGRAAAGPAVDDIVLVGSPGTGAGSVSGRRTRARGWAARGADARVGGGRPHPPGGRPAAGRPPPPGAPARESGCARARAKADAGKRVGMARGADDWVAEVPHISTDLFGTTVGFGTDPVSPAFGARVFAAGPGGHSAYFTPGSVSLANLTRIVLGETSEVTRA
ncbi:alpha/beta hydrolase [Streptomyces sp. NPDC059378]|uniref:alpha/beta hydrolase n=1 Tax=Streptomyces sp. NPDC059378 TaxID=3346815 RepID=UPI0036ABFC24